MELIVIFLVGASIFSFNETKVLNERLKAVEVVSLGTISGGVKSIETLSKRIDALEIRESFREDTKLRRAIDKNIKKLESKEVL